MNFRTSLFIYRATAWVMLAMVLLSWLCQARWVGVVGIVILVLGLVQSLIFCRCPYCRKNLDLHNISQFCPE